MSKQRPKPTPVVPAPAAPPFRPPTWFDRPDWLLAGLLAIASWVAFSNGLRGDWVFDDRLQILKNTLVTTPGKAWTALTSDVWSFAAPVPGQPGGFYWRPVFTAQLLVQHRLFGFDSTVGWHAVNISLHAIVSVLAFALLRRLSVSRPLAFGAACVFALHPSRVESVTWISGSPDLLLGVGLLGAMLMAARLARSNTCWAWLGLILCGLFATGAKEIGMFTPIFVGLVVWVDRQDCGLDPTRARSLRRSIDVALPLVAISIAYVFMRDAIVMPSIVNDTAPKFEGVLLSVPSISMFYLRQSFWPWQSLFRLNPPVLPPEVAGQIGLDGVGPGHPLRAVSPDQLSTANFYLPLAFCVVIGLAMLLLAWRSRIALLGLAIFVLTLGPALMIQTFPADHTVRDRYLYIPLLGLLLMIVGAVKQFSVRNPTPSASAATPLPPPVHRPLVSTIAAAVLILAAIPMAVRTWAYNRTWTSEALLWQEAVRYDPTSAHALTEAARVMRDAGMIDEAIEAYSRSIALRPAVMALTGRAGIYLKAGRLEEAEQDATKAVLATRGKPEDNTVMQCYDLLILVFERAKKFDGPNGAAAAIREARRRFPAQTLRYTNQLSVDLIEVGKKDEALREISSVLDVASKSDSRDAAMVYYRTAVLYVDSGEPGRALPLFREFLRRSEPWATEPNASDLRGKVLKALPKIEADANNKPG